MALPKVAIVVLNYNGKDCLPSCLASLRAVPYPAKEVIVVDNASEDGSLERAQADFPEFAYLKSSRNLGFAGGMNLGIRRGIEEGAEWLWLFNNDAKSEAEALTRLISAAQTLPTAGLLSPLILRPDKSVWFSGGKTSFLRMRTGHSVHIPGHKPYASRFLTGCALLVRRTVVETVGFLDEDFFLYYEDADYSLRSRRAGFGLYVVPDAHVIHEEKSGTNPQKNYHLVLSGLVFFGKHARGFWRAYIGLYVTIRKVKNQLDRRLGREGASSVQQAYVDYASRQHDHLPSLR